MRTSKLTEYEAFKKSLKLLEEDSNVQYVEFLKHPISFTFHPWLSSTLFQNKDRLPQTAHYFYCTMDTPTPFEQAD